MIREKTRFLTCNKIRIEIKLGSFIPLLVLLRFLILIALQTPIHFCSPKICRVCGLKLKCKLYFDSLLNISTLIIIISTALTERWNMIHKLTTSNHCKSKTRAFIALLKIITLSEEKIKGCLMLAYSLCHIRKKQLQYKWELLLKVKSLTFMRSIESWMNLQNTEMRFINLENSRLKDYNSKKNIWLWTSKIWAYALKEN